MDEVISFTSNDFSTAVSYTLLHSLWQGALAFLLVWILRFLITSAESRYALGIGGLWSLILVIVYTFYLHLENSVEEEEYNSITQILTYSISNIEERTQNYSTLFDYVYMFWLAGILFFSFRFVISLYSLEKYKTDSVLITDSEILQLLKDVKSKVGIKDSVVLKESNFLESPATIGWLKPIVLFPIGLLTNLGSSEIEVILAHELAHIKRKDFVVNMINSVLEVLLFFNPFVWLLSAIIREERENCCDNVAVEVCGNKILLAQVLVKVADYSLKNKFKMTFVTEKKSVLRRVKRLLTGVSQYKIYNIIGLLLIISLISGGVVYGSKESRKVILNALVFDSETFTPLVNAKVYDNRNKLVGKTDDKGFFSVSLRVNDKGDIDFSYSVKKDGYEKFIQNEHWADLDSGSEASYYVGLTKKSSEGKSFSKLMLAGMSSPELENDLPVFVDEILLNRKIENIQIGNEEVFFVLDNKYLIINNFGFIEITSPESKILLKGRIIPAKTVNNYIKRGEIKGMTTLKNKDAVVEIFGK